jgi:hypothetical protein
LTLDPLASLDPRSSLPPAAQAALLGALPGVQLPAGADLVVLEQVSTPEHAKVV